MIKFLEERYKKEMFQPGIIGFFINPFFIIRRGLYKNIKANAPKLTGELLDFGCGRKPYRSLFKNEVYIGVDVEVSGHDKALMQVDVYYDGKTLPFDSNRFDSVFSAEVFEHVFELDAALDEINRVTKPGGHLLITVPFVWEEHEVPNDFGRYSSFGISYLLQKHGFEVVSLSKTTSTVSTLFQLWNSYLYGCLRFRWVQLVLNPFLITPFTALGLVLGWILPNSGKLFHNSVVLAKKVSG